MDWAAQVDGYCERVDFSYWAEPLNAVTNLGYLLVGLWFWRRFGGQGRGHVTGRLLAGLLVAIAIGSYLFHTHATRWAGLADTAPIGLFILVYLLAVNRDMVGLPWWGAGLATALYLPFVALAVPILNGMPFFQISSFYWTVPLALAGYAGWLRRRHPDAAAGLGLAAAILVISITIRSVDESLCPYWPWGTHFLWHLINAGMFVVVLGTYQQHLTTRR